MALGADQSNLMRLVLSRGFMLTGAGLLVGAVAAMLLTRLMGDMLYKISPRDPIAFGSATAVMIVASLLACYLPARRASRIDPLKALKGD